MPISTTIRSPAEAVTVLSMALAVELLKRLPAAVVRGHSSVDTGEAIWSTTNVPLTVSVSPAVTKIWTWKTESKAEAPSDTPSIICQVSTPAVKVTASVSASLTQRPVAQSLSVTGPEIIDSWLTEAPAETSPNFFLNDPPVISQAPRQVVGPVPEMAAFWR